MCLRRYITALLLLAATGLQAAPGDILFQEQFNNTADLTADWTTDSEARVNAVTGNPTPSLSIEAGNGARSATSRPIDTQVPSASLSFWVRRGFDTQGGNCPSNQTCSEYPEGGENFQVQYLNSSNNWITLITYTGGGTSGEIFTYDEPLPADGLHAAFRLRFTHVGGNQGGWDLWHADDVLITETIDIAATCSTTSTIFYEAFNNNGDLNSDWNTDNGVRINSITFGAASPSVSIDGRSGLHGITSKSNRIDANVAAARLGFWVRRGFDTQNNGCPTNQNCSEDTDDNENLVVEYLNNANSWQPIITYEGGGTKGEILNYSALLPGDALYSGLRLRFLHTGGSGSTWDLWHIDDVLVEQCTGSAGPDHYSINNLATTAVSCEAINLTIEAHDASHNLTDALSATVTLTTSTGRGTWSGTGISDATPNDGTATLTFSSGADSMNVQLSHPDLGGNTSETININVSDGSITEISGNAIALDDPSTVISDSGFRFIEVAGATTTATIPSQVAGVLSSQNLFIEAIRTDLDTGSCTGVYPAGTTVNVDLAAECKNPQNCAGLQVAITNNGNTTSIATSNDNSGTGAAAYTGVNLLFASDSRAAFSLRYRDVGNISLHARDTVNLPGNVSDTLTGESNGFVVKPYTLMMILAESNDATPINNPGTTTALPGFLPAAASFRVVVESQDADGNRTPNYGNETIPETVSASFGSLIFPVGTGAANGTFSSGTFTATATPGQFESTTASWTEAGTFTLIADIGDSNYLGAGGVASPAESGNIGRFYPADFALSGEALDQWCEASGTKTGSFSYLSQPNLRLTYTLTARNRSGNPVLNYDNTDLNYLITSPDVPIGAINYHAENADNGINLNARVTVSPSAPIAWDNGVYRLTDVPGQLNRIAAPDGPFTETQFSLDVTDPDGAVLDIANRNQNPDTSGDCLTPANCTSAALGNPQVFRFGRTVIEDASGPESAPLPVIFGTEYWDGTNFITTTNDSCSTLAFSEITYATNNPIANPQPVAVGSGTSNGSLNAAGSAAAVTSGTFGLIFLLPMTQVNSLFRSTSPITPGCALTGTRTAITTMILPCLTPPSTLVPTVVTTG